MAVDPRTPVLVGVGQFTERIDDPGYRGMSAVELATEAARAALADTGADAGRSRRRHRRRRRPAAVRDLRGRMPAPLGRSNNYPRSVMQRLGGAAGACGARARRRPGPAEAGDRVRHGDRRRRRRRRDDHRLGARFDANATSPTGTTSRISPSTSTASSRTAATRSTTTSSEYTVQARAHRCAGAVRPAGQRPPRRGSGSSVGEYRQRDGRAVRAVVESRCEEPVLRHRRWSARSRRSRRSPTRTG